MPSGGKLNGDRIAQLCVIFPVLIREARVAGRVPEVETLVRQARAGREIGADLVALCRTLGLPYDEPVRKWPWSGGSGHTAREVFVCPAARCTRAWVREPGVPLPVCGLEQAPLRREHR